MLAGGFQALKYAVYRQVRTLLERIEPGAGAAIRYSDISLSLFPPGVRLTDVRGLPIRHRSLVSFASVNVTLPFHSLFTRRKTLNIELLRPVIVLDSSLWQDLGRGGRSAGNYRLGQIDISHGRLQVRAGNLTLQLEDFNLHSRPRADGTRARLDVPYMRSELPIGRARVPLEGQMNADILLSNEGELRISRFLWQTRDLRVGLNGQFAAGGFTLHAAVQGNPVRLLEPELGKITVAGLVYANVTVRASRGSDVHLRGDFSAPALAVKGIEHRDVTGTVSWNSRDHRLLLDARLSAAGTRSAVHIESRGGQTDIRGRDVPGSTLAHILEVERDAPLGGLARTGTVHIDSGEIAGEADLSAAGAPPSPFALNGRVVFRRDKRRRETTFAVENGGLPAGRVTLHGLSRSEDRRLELDIQAEFRDLQQLDPLARYYLKLPLAPWRLEGGRGSLRLQLRKRNGRGSSRASVALYDFFSRRQAIAALQGEVLSSPPQVSGTFSIRARDLRARAALAIDAGALQLSFRDIEAEAAAIAGLLGKALPLRGRIDGELRFRKEKNRPQPTISGRLHAARLVVAGQILEEVNTALHTDLQGINLPDLRFRLRGGQGEAAVAIDFAARRFDLRGRLLGLDLGQFIRSVSGRLEVNLSGRGEFLRDPISFDYRLSRVRHYADRPFEGSGRGELRTDFSSFSVQSSGTLVNAAGESPFGMELRRRDGRYSGSFNLQLRDLNLLIPWPNNDGNLRLLGEINGATLADLECRGVVMVAGRTLVLPGFPHSLNNFQGNITFSNLNVNLQSLSGELGGGRAEFNGRLSAGRGGLRELELNLNGRDMTLFPMDRVSLRLNAGLTLAYRNRRLLLSGTMHFLGAEWERQVDEPLSFSTRSKLSAAESHIRETLQLDIHLTGDENIWMNNAFGRISAKFDLRLSGSARYPQLIGTIEGTGGSVNFSERKFGLVRGRITFNNRFVIDPLVQIESETFVQNYRISMFIRGSLSRPKPELVSSPPLPPQDILALISLGEIFKRPGSEEVSSQLGSTALLSSELTKEIKSRANKLLGIDLLRLDPLMTGTTGSSTSRLTVGKSISKNLIVVYSTNLATYRQEIYYLQYQLSPTLSLIAMRNEEGNYAFDIRFRKRK